jgi:chromosome segregation ATPase
MTIDPTALISYSRGGELPKSVRSALERAVELRNKVMDLDRQIGEHTQQLAQITQEQTRIREDMKAVSQSTPYYGRLLAKLNDQESLIERLQKEREDLTGRRDDQRKEYESYLANLVVD